MTTLHTSEEALDSVHTAETMLGAAEKHWRDANSAAQVAKAEFETARRLYTAARRDYTASVGTGGQR